MAVDRPSATQTRAVVDCKRAKTEGGVKPEGEAGVSEQFRAAGLPGLPSCTRGGLPVGLVPVGASEYTETRSIGVVESSLALLLELDNSDEGLTHVGQSLHGIKTISGGCSDSIDHVVSDSDGGSE